ncbi:MAG: sulfotransferase [Candidatus Sedimenticola sp. (ex Thyasira tokunagai)]
MQAGSPVFIVGPVRSGSTFLRLMLDFHPNINNPGECDFLFDMVSDNGEYSDLSTYKNWLSTSRIFQAAELKVDPNLGFRDLIHSFASQFESDNDVLTMNVHRHFHRIPYLFPDARYIHLLRDPRDVARSCIGMGWVGHVYFGADVWYEAEASWDRLKADLEPNQYIEISYEDILDDVAKGLSKLCEFLGVKYSARMLDYADNSTYGLPDKSLSYQWKRKYSDRELQLVEGKLEGMITAKGYELSGLKPVSPSMLERISLLVKNKHYRAMFQINRYGLMMFLEGLLVRRVGYSAWRESYKSRRNTVDIKYLK